MAWKYTDAGKVAVTDGKTTIPLGSKTGMSRKMVMLIANGLEIADAEPSPVSEPSQFTLEDVIAACLKAGILERK